ncbi:protein-tyrosine phosphatase family protein [Providencia sp.]|uniref:protein-tyrosine phosphatase family protein n=1 Tax=Providencia sp. TaxID=589 RepID=UPI003F9D927E
MNVFKKQAVIAQVTSLPHSTEFTDDIAGVKEQKTAPPTLLANMKSVKNTTIKTPFLSKIQSAINTLKQWSHSIIDKVIGIRKQHVPTDTQNIRSTASQNYEAIALTQGPSNSLLALDEQLSFEQLKAMTSQRITDQKIVYVNKSNGVLGARYSDIPTAKKTQVHIIDELDEKIGLPANHLQINGENIAIRSQYPIEDSKKLENHIRMIVDNKVPAILILASKNDITKGKLPAYFMENKKSGAFEVTVTRPNKHITIKKGELIIERYKMKISYAQDGIKKNHYIPVSHVTNWEDKTTVKAMDVVALAKEVNLMTKTKLNGWATSNRNKENNPREQLPLIHCKAGVGRTGLVVGAMQLMKSENTLSATEIILDLRESGTPTMVQTREQHHTLQEIEKIMKTDKLV